jgi:hypothetical protein
MQDTKIQYEKLVLVPMKKLEEIQEGQKQILEAVSSIPESRPVLKGLIGNKYIPESEAQKMLGRKTTWFFNMRKSGKLEFKKLGGRTYYSLEDIEKLLNGEDCE